MKAITFEKKYINKSENDIVILAREGDEEANSYLFKRYERLIKSIASNYFFIGWDQDDVIQEGMFGLYKAIRDYNPDKIFCFKQFARLCISRQIMATVKKACGAKHTPLNYYISLDKHVYEDGLNTKTLADILADNSMYEPDKEVIYQELSKDLKKVIRENLSKFEKKVVELHLESKSYENIARVLSCEVKSVDNALQRVRKKIKNTVIIED